MSTEKSKSEADLSSSNASDQEDNWGYDLYPERRGEAPKPKWWQMAFFGEGRTSLDRTNCEQNVYKCFQNSKLMGVCDLDEMDDFHGFLHCRSIGKINVQSSKSLRMVRIIPFPVYQTSLQKLSCIAVK